MGLGTKIKEALQGDREHREHQAARNRKTTPGAYPESTVDVPRSMQHDTTHDGTLNSNKPLPGTKAESIASTQYSDYTHSGITDTVGPLDNIGLTSGYKDGERVPTTSPKVSSPQNGKLSKENKHPYWGNTGKGTVQEVGVDANANEHKATFHSERDSVISNGFAPKGVDEHSTKPRVASGQDYHSLLDPTRNTFGNETNGNGATSPETAGTATNLTHLPSKSGTNARDQKINDYDAPTSSSDRGKAGFAAAGTGAAAGLGAAKLSQRHHEQDLRDYESTGVGHENAGYGTPGLANGRHHDRDADEYEYEDSPASRRVPVGGARGGRSDAYGAAGSEFADRPRRNFGSVRDPSHGLSKTKPAVDDSPYARQLDDRYSPDSPTARETNGKAYPKTAGFGGAEREHGSAGSGSDFGSGSVAPIRAREPDHYGPGHAGAKVLHRCDHCGIDNDVTKYFSKEAIYRMS